MLSRKNVSTACTRAGRIPATALACLALERWCGGRAVRVAEDDDDADVPDTLDSTRELSFELDVAKTAGRRATADGDRNAFTKLDATDEAVATAVATKRELKDDDADAVGIVVTAGAATACDDTVVATAGCCASGRSNKRFAAVSCDSDAAARTSLFVMF